MGAERFSIGPENLESIILARLAQLTLSRQSEASYWIATDDNGEPDGTYMVVCVLGPECIADLRTAMTVLEAKWEAEGNASDESH